MKLTLFQVDAFAENLFEGNPAAVIPLKEWLPDEMMQKIAMENNLSETAFIIESDDHFHIRWFTPLAEVKLCGHATLASAHVILNHLNYKGEEINFNSLSGILKVKKQKNLIVLNFPSSPVIACEIPPEILKAFDFSPVSGFKGNDDYMLVFRSEEQIVKLDPDFSQLIKANTRGVICTSRSENYDFVSRFFAPAVGVNEDPVTGSAHTMLIPYWAKVLQKNELEAKQVSKRGGILYCKNVGERIEIGGKAVTFFIGEVSI